MRGFDIDLEDVADLSNFSGIVPLFPLATVVFFPNTLLPLHVFEPRYRQMVKDVLTGERVIGMVLLKPGWEKSYHGNPEIYNVACMGRVVSAEPLEEGRFNIVLFGLKRVKVIETVKELPYRSARVRVLEDIHGGDEHVYGERIRQVILKWNAMLGREQASHRINIETEMPAGKLTDAVASSVISNVFDKQYFLEETNVERRAQKILNHLETKFQVVSLLRGRSSQIVEKRNFN